jgi:type II secretory pathway predicted ATPase ExeA
MQELQAITEEYIQYWGLSQHPFLLAPDSRMVHVTGQYYECLERLKYAINTNKGGVLIISEDAGLGKTTILLRLIEDMKDEYGGAFKCAFIDHPSLTSSQMIAQITESISGQVAYEDKLKNLMLLKDALVAVKQSGGKSIIIVDEGQMLCHAAEVLQELRVLINLTHDNQYLHTFILSGQRPLWDTVKDMPEFWQRLPVRYYFVPLRLEETKEMVRFRLSKSGLDEGKEVFTEDALEIIHRYARGSPRTIMALSDLSLLIGYTGRVSKIGFKEVSKAINAMSGKGETLPYVKGDKKASGELSLGGITDLRTGSSAPARARPKDATDSKDAPERQRSRLAVRPVFAVLAVIFFILAGGFGYRQLFLEKKGVAAVPARTAVAAKEIAKQAETPQIKAETPQVEVEPNVSAEIKLSQETQAAKEPVLEKGAKTEKGARRERAAKQETSGVKEQKKKPLKEVVVSKDAANVRLQPDIRAQRIGMIFRGERLRVADEKIDREGEKWYKVTLYGERQGWIAALTVVAAPGKP